jgi:glycosyltransferase involved in cell wall biosynthesis
MKLFVALGPGDIVSAHRAMMAGERSSETSIIASGQLLEYCRAQSIETLALSYHRRKDSLHDELLWLENRPRVWEVSSGGRYHLSRIFYGLYLCMRAWQFGADLAIIDSGSTHYFALAGFRLIGIPVAINFHNTLWPNGFEPEQFIQRAINFFDMLFFWWLAAGSTGVSPECGHQVRQLAGPFFPFFEYRCQFGSNEFSSHKQRGERNPFRVIFVGRAERNKGVLDIAAIAERLREQSTTPIVFEVSGDGNALPELRRIVEEKQLGGSIIVHGRLPRTELFQLYSRAHAVIVPTRSDYCEGLPAVCAEAVLSGLPIITSRLSNAVPVLGPSLMEAEPEDIESYVRAIRRLAEDASTYTRLRNACPELAKQFIDRARSYPAATDLLIGHLFPGWKQLKNYEPLFARIGNSKRAFPSLQL